MSSREYSVADLVRVIEKVHNLLEGCIQRYMNKSECKHALQFHHGIDPDITEIIWHRIERGNEEFFRAYYARLVLIEQIRKFNSLLEEQGKWMVGLSGVSAPVHIYDPSPDLYRQQASPSAPARQNRPLKAEDMQKLQECHNFGSSIQPSPLGFINAPFCDRQNTEMYSVLIADEVFFGAPLRTVNMQQCPVTNEFGSMGDVPYPAPQFPISYGAGPSNPGFFQENVYTSGYDPNFESSQNLVHPRRNRDPMMTQTDRSVNTGEAGYGGSLAFNPGSYSYSVDSSFLTGDASINSLSSEASKPTNLNARSLEEMEDKTYGKTLLW